MKLIVNVTLIFLASLAIGCVEKTVPTLNGTSIGILEHNPHYFSDGTTVIEYKGSTYIVVKGMECISICPALPAKLEDNN